MTTPQPGEPIDPNLLGDLSDITIGDDMTITETTGLRGALIFAIQAAAIAVEGGEPTNVDEVRTVEWIRQTVVEALLRMENDNDFWNGLRTRFGTDTSDPTQQQLEKAASQLRSNVLSFLGSTAFSAKYTLNALGEINRNAKLPLVPPDVSIALARAQVSRLRVQLAAETLSGPSGGAAGSGSPAWRRVVDGLKAVGLMLPVLLSTPAGQTIALPIAVNVVSSAAYDYITEDGDEVNRETTVLAQRSENYEQYMKMLEVHRQGGRLPEDEYRALQKQALEKYLRP